ncbi:PepSY domain-containing protein [Streptomyces chartreusis]
MQRRTKWIVTGVAALALAGGGSSLALAASSGDTGDTPISGPALAKASAAALEHTNGGTVTQTEVGDEDSYYEVEVTLDNGKQTDVQLNKDFKVVSSTIDKESPSTAN